MNISPKLPTLAAALLLGLSTSSVAEAVSYFVTDLGPLPTGTDNDYAHDVNANGDIAGYVSLPGFDTRAMRWAGGMFDVQGTLGGDSSTAYAINADNTIVGVSDTGVDFDTVPFRQLEGGAMESLGSLGGNFGVAQDINDAGIITGHSHDGTSLRAFVWEEGTGMTDIGNFTPTGSSTGQGINAAGHVAGAGTTVLGEQHAFYWDGNTMLDLGTIAAGEQSYAYSLNDANTVVGYGSLNAAGSTYGAFRWTAGGGIEQLDQLFSYDTRARDINNHGDIVGSSWIDGMGNSRAVLWPGGGAVVHLNDEIDPGGGWLLTNATGINDAGQIVGVGNLNGASRAFMLTVIPEPSGTGLACLTLALLPLWGRRAMERKNVPR